MPLLEIFTDVGAYTATLIEHGLCLQVGDSPTTVPLTPVEVFQQARSDALNGCIMQGWTPTDDPNDEPHLFTIEQGARVLSMKLYTPTKTTENADASEKAESPVGKVYEISFDGEVLGNPVHITGLGIRTTTTEYLLPLRVGEMNACDSMKGAALAQQVQLWKETQGVPSTDYLVVIPDVPMTKADARDYLVDYADEAEPTTRVHGEGTAKAWPGWNET